MLTRHIERSQKPEHFRHTKCDSRSTKTNRLYQMCSRRRQEWPQENKIAQRKQERLILNVTLDELVVIKMTAKARPRASWSASMANWLLEACFVRPMSALSTFRAASKADGRLAKQPRISCGVNLTLMRGSRVRRSGFTDAFMIFSVFSQCSLSLPQLLRDKPNDYLRRHLGLPLGDYNCCTSGRLRLRGKLRYIPKIFLKAITGAVLPPQWQLSPLLAFTGDFALALYIPRLLWLRTLSNVRISPEASRCSRQAGGFY